MTNTLNEADNTTPLLKDQRDGLNLAEAVKKDIAIVAMNLQNAMEEVEDTDDYKACVNLLKKFKRQIEKEIKFVERQWDLATETKGLDGEETENCDNFSDEVDDFWTKEKIFFCLAIFYIAFGNFWFIWRYGYSFVDAMFTIVVIFTTVGYGIEIVESEIDQFVIIIYVIFGVGIIFSGAGSVIVDFVSQHKQKKHVFMHREGEEREGDTLYSTEVNRDLGSAQGVLNVCLECLEMQWVQLTLWIGFTLGGAFLIGWFEEWHWFESVYFAVMSGSTVGFGDYTPSHFWGKVLLIFYLPILVACTGYAFAVVFSKAIYSVVNEDKEEMKKFNRSIGGLLNESNFHTNLKLIDINGDGVIDRNEYTICCLLNESAVDRNHIHAIHSQFDKLDVDGDGDVTIEDFYEIYKNAQLASN